MSNTKPADSRLFRLGFLCKIKGQWGQYCTTRQWRGEEKAKKVANARNTFLKGKYNHYTHLVDEEGKIHPFNN